MDNKQKLQEGLTALGLTLTTAQQLLLLEYVALLKKWNGTYNRLISSFFSPCILSFLLKTRKTTY